MDSVQAEIDKQETLARLKKLISKSDRMLAYADEQNKIARRMAANGFGTDAAHAARRAQRKLADERKLRPAIAELREWMRREIAREKRRVVR
jgi:hypothetical protein